MEFPYLMAFVSLEKHDSQRIVESKQTIDFSLNSLRPSLLCFHISVTLARQQSGYCYLKGMCFGIASSCRSVNVPFLDSSFPRSKCQNLQDIIIQADDIWIAKYKVEILQGLREPEAFHSIPLVRLGGSDIFNSCICYVCMRMMPDG